MAWISHPFSYSISEPQKVKAEATLVTSFHLVDLFQADIIGTELVLDQSPALCFALHHSKEMPLLSDCFPLTCVSMSFSVPLLNFVLLLEGREYI